jgi:hypothetical protein
MSIAAAIIPGAHAHKAPKAWIHIAGRCLLIALKLFISLSLMTDICTVTWQNQVGTKYRHIDDIGWFGFLSPGQWVDETVVTVPKLILTPATWHMDENGYVPDTILEGWSVPRLWRYWWSYLAVDLAVALALTAIPWRATLLRFRRLTHYPDWLVGFLYVPLVFLAIITFLSGIFVALTF